MIAGQRRFAERGGSGGGASEDGKLRRQDGIETLFLRKGEGKPSKRRSALKIHIRNGGGIMRPPK